VLAPLVSVPSFIPGFTVRTATTTLVTNRKKGRTNGRTIPRSTKRRTSKSSRNYRERNKAIREPPIQARFVRYERNLSRTQNSSPTRQGDEMDIETKLDLLLIELEVYAKMIEQLEKDMVAFNEWLQAQL